MGAQVVHVATAFAAMALGLAAMPFGPFPWLRNVRFEPGVFVGTAMLAAWILSGSAP